MSSPLRHNEPGAVYHAYNRGARKLPIYLDDQDRRVFIAIQANAIARHPIELLAFCLMGNHFHLLLRTMEACLDEFMRDVMSRYVRYFNDQYGFDGRLCRDRFQSKLVADPRYARAVTNYIHSNPTALGYRNRLSDYPWSSLAMYLDPQAAPWWLNTEPMLNTFGGPERFAQQARTTSPSRMHAEAGPAEVYEAWAMEHVFDVLSAVADLTDWTIEKLLVPCRDNKIERAVAMQIVRVETDLPYTELAGIFGYASDVTMRRSLAQGLDAVEADPGATDLLLTAQRILR